jgi:hypothetical protein
MKKITSTLIAIALLILLASLEMGCATKPPVQEDTSKSPVQKDTSKQEKQLPEKAIEEIEEVEVLAIPEAEEIEKKEIPAPPVTEVFDERETDSGKSAPAAKAPMEKPAAAKKPQQALGSGEIKQQISYARLMLMSKIGKRVTESDNAKAKELLSNASMKLNKVNSKFQAGKLKGLAEELTKIYGMITKASLLVPSSDLKSEQQKRYVDMQKKFEEARQDHQKSYKDAISRLGESAGIKYDVAKVEALIAEADKLSLRKKYNEATDLLAKAVDVIQLAISEMYDNQTLVYELDLSTPEKEYEYEHQRYLSYVELIPVAIEMKMPTAGQMMLINRLIEKGKNMSAEAIKTAKAGDYPTAIRMTMDATKQIRRALRVMGVKQ